MRPVTSCKSLDFDSNLRRGSTKGFAWHWLECCLSGVLSLIPRSLFFRNFREGETVFAAIRSHLYQRPVIAGYSLLYPSYLS